MSHVQPTLVDHLPWWRRLLTLEPAVVRGVVGAVVLVLGLWGVDAADLGGRVETTVLTLLTLVPLVTGWWTRTVVTPDAKVVEAAERDIDGVWVVRAGEANELPTGEVVRALRDDSLDGF